METNQKRPLLSDKTRTQQHQTKAQPSTVAIATISESTRTSLSVDGNVIRTDAAGRYSLNDLHRAAMAVGKATESQRPGEFLRTDNVQRFISAFDARQGSAGKAAVSAISVKTGRMGGTYAAELVAIRYATWIDADFEVSVYLTFQSAAKSRDNWRKLRHESASSCKVLNAVLHMVRQDVGKATEAHHYANEAKLVNWALAGAFKGLDRDALSAAELALLAYLEERNAVLIGRGLSYDQRKPMLKQYAVNWRSDGHLVAFERAK